MFKLLKSFAWILIIAICLISLDQFLTRVPLEVAGAKQAQTFYVDFRNRLLSMVGLESLADHPKKTIEQVIETTQKAAPEPAKTSSRYLYADDSGALQFADSLEQVPDEYRANAQPMSE